MDDLTHEAATNVERRRRGAAPFPSLGQTVHGQPLVYLDSAASAQKPRAMIEAVSQAYAYGYSNVHRGVHTLSQQATEAYEGSREKIQHFIGAGESSRRSSSCAAPPRGSTWWPRASLARGSGRATRCLISAMEHHSNIVPWQSVCEKTGASLRVVPINDAGEIEISQYERMLSDRTRMVAMVHVSNAWARSTRPGRSSELAKARGCSGSFRRRPGGAPSCVDVQDLDCDFYTISGHKLFGPTGIGALYGKRSTSRPWSPTRAAAR